MDCKNCNKKIRKNTKFCSNCGQRTDELITVGLLFKNTIANYFSMDGKIFKSIGPLLFKPGYLAKEFINGKRLTYIHPAQLFILFSAILFFSFSFFNPSIGYEKKTKIDLEIEGSKLDSLNEIEASLDEKISTLFLKKNEKISEITYFKKILYTKLIKMDESNEFQTKSLILSKLSLALFIFLPSFSLLLWWFFKSSGKYAHHLVFSFYNFSFTFIWLKLIYHLGDWFENFSNFFTIIGFFLLITYFLISIHHFYERSWKETILKTIGLLILALGILFPIHIIVIIALVVISF